ncbi:hypothetical protein [Allobaculum sp. Allo2]|uniref:hypothetical protein n=1 Tax=Allobaculum sp. Allo2 TaxID=2853432 RepID=UPI001F614DC5|nr:hypothetical protein [Allobaculum sp. Allo2]
MTKTYPVCDLHCDTILALRERRDQNQDASLAKTIFASIFKNFEKAAWRCRRLRCLLIAATAVSPNTKRFVC